MKQLLIFCFSFGIISSTFGQNIIEKHFSTYKNQDNFTHIHVTSKAFELTAYLEFEDAEGEFEEFKEFLSTVTSFDMIAGEKVEQAEKKYQAALKKVQSSHDELMTIDEHEGTFSFLIDEANGMVKELIIVGTQHNKLAIFSLTGNMDLSQLSKMLRMMDAGSGKQLTKMFENGIHEIKVYPNPIAKGEQLTIQVPDELASSKVSILNMNGATVKTFTLSSTRHQLKLEGMAAGNYIVEFKTDQASIKKKIIVR